MSKGGKKANEFMKKKLGADVDAAAGAAGFRPSVIDGGDGDDSQDTRPMIELPCAGRPGSQFAREMGRIMAKEPIFLRDRYPVLVDPETGMVEPLTADEFRTTAEDFCVPYKYVARQGGSDDEPATMTKDVAGYTLKSPQFRSALRRLDRVNLVRMPVIRGDGTPVLLPEGYDEEKRTFTLTSGIRINEALKPEEGQAIIRDYLSEFPFTDDRSKAVAVAAMVAIYVSQMQELTAARMGSVFRSNVEGAGKSLLAQCAISPAYGLAEGQPLAGKEELRKLLDATAMAGSPYLFLDNLAGFVGSELLDAYLTTPIWTGRLLGTPKIFKAPANAMLLVTGNNIDLSADISRRTLVCNLNVEEANPDERQPRRVMTPQFLARPEVRGDMLSALWAMVRGWKAAGMPAGARRIRSFEEWSDLVGGIVRANGFGDCLAKPPDEESPNRKEVDKRGLVERLVELFPEGKKVCEFRFDELVEVCRDRELFDWLVDGRMVKESEKRDDGGYDHTEHFECTRKSAGALAHVFNKEMGGQIYRTKDGRRVRFGTRGKQRHKRFQLELIAVTAAGGAAGGAGAAPAA